MPIVIKKVNDYFETVFTILSVVGTDEYRVVEKVTNSLVIADRVLNMDLQARAVTSLFTGDVNDKRG